MDEKNHTFPDLSEEDIIDAMKSIEGYIDITPSDVRHIYQLAFEHALHRIHTAITAKEIMSSPVLTLSNEMSITDATYFLADHHISGAPVVDGTGKVQGILTEKDFTRALGMKDHASVMDILSRCMKTSTCMVADLQTRFLSDLMSSPVITGTKEMSIAEISALFITHGISHLVICDENLLPIGMVSRKDLIGALCG